MELALNNFEVLDQTQMEEIDGGAFSVGGLAKAAVGGAVSGAVSTYCNTKSIKKSIVGAGVGALAGSASYLATCWY